MGIGSGVGVGSLTCAAFASSSRFGKSDIVLVPCIEN